MLRCGLDGVVGPGDYVESILVPSGLGRRAYRSRAGGVRKWASGFGKSAAIRTFRTLIGESGNYPMYITFCRRVLVDLPPPKKKSAGSPNRTSARKRRRAGGHEIICLLDSSDEEEDQDQDEIGGSAGQIITALRCKLREKEKEKPLFKCLICMVGI